jgi:hypothetical protein
MPLIRILLLLLVLAGLTLLLVQNWLPVLPLVFLGVKTQTLPLAIWILICFAAGVLTSMLIAGLFKLSNYFATPQPPKRPRDFEPTQKASSTPRSEAPSSTNRPPPSNTNSNPTSASDWDNNPTDEDDWDIDEDATKQQNSGFRRDDIRDSTTYERQQQPKTSSQSGSAYSYSYKEPRNSSVGKTESVYDAEYRVITPPYQQTNTVKQEEEDWGFEGDDDWDNEEEGSSKKR